MKKIALLIVMLTLTQAPNFAQETKCAPYLLEDLSLCFSTRNISASLIFSSDGSSASLFFEGTPNQGEVTACLAQYDNGRMSCPEAPIIIQDSKDNYRGGRH